MDEGLQIKRLEALSRITAVMAGDPDLEFIVQTITDAATELAGARYGAFFYNVTDDQGERFRLYTLSGAPRSAFDAFGMPRNTALFDPTFRGTGTIRSDDITADPRYGKNAPYFGMPEGHLPVVSYLAMPVVSRSGEIHGGLFFGHEEAGVFTQEAEDAVKSIAAHAAIALDNAQLMQAAKNETEHRRLAEEATARLAAIVEFSDDAIISKDLNGIITSWNSGAERLFGYSVEEAIGRSITMLIPPDRQDEEPLILNRILKGERIAHYETLRQRKDGSLIEISLSVSPIRNASGQIIGASKIGRDITDRKRTQAQQTLLLREMNHRVKNLFALASGVVSLSARSADTAEELAEAIQARLAALARAHSLTLPGDADGKTSRRAGLRALAETILSPYVGAEGRITINGSDVRCGPRCATSFALLLHEFATNSVKYGALSRPTGRVSVTWSSEGKLDLQWVEEGGPRRRRTVSYEGFGSLLTKATILGLGGSLSRDWTQNGLKLSLSAPLDRMID